MAALPRTAVAPCQHLDRLPRGTDRDIGGGYATAMAAAGATACSPLVVGVATAVIAVQVAAAGDTVPVAFRVMAPIGLAIGTLQTAVTVAVGGPPARCAGRGAVRADPGMTRRHIRCHTPSFRLATPDAPNGTLIAGKYKWRRRW